MQVATYCFAYKHNLWVFFLNGEKMYFINNRKEEQHNLWLLEQYLHISIIDLFYSMVKFLCPLARPDERSSKVLRAWTDPTRINNNI